MDEVAADEVTEHNKENEFSLKPGSSSMLQSDEMVTPGVDEYPENSSIRYEDILDAKVLDRIGSSEHASASPRCMDGVEELTLRNYDGENLTIMGSPNNVERIPTRGNLWQNFYQIAGGSGQTGYKGKGQATSSAYEERGKDFFSGLKEQNHSPTNYNHNAVVENLLSNDASGDVLYSSGGIRSKILSKSGFSEYFIKSTLRGKGVIHRSQICNQDHPKTNPVSPLGLPAKPVLSLSDSLPQLKGSRSSGDRTSLREWLEADGKKASKLEKLRIFRQILDLVDFSHSRGVSLRDLRPSCLKLSASNTVTYLGFTGPGGVTENVSDQDIKSNQNRKEKRPVNHGMIPYNKKQKLGENMNYVQRWPQFPSRSGIRSASINVANVDNGDSLYGDEEHNSKIEIKKHSDLVRRNVPNSSRTWQDSESFMLEEKWYTSPEMFNEKGYTFASNIYCLGILLFELLGSFDSGRSHAAAMLDLRHRILPPNFLSENPKEAGFCLWLLHPEPSLRPTAREILQSEFISGIQALPGGGELLPSVDEEDGNSELLLYFLSSLNEQKQKDASNLVKQIQYIEADIQEVEKRRPKLLENAASSKISPLSDQDTRLMNNIRQLENAYFSMRSHIKHSDSNAIHRDGELLKSRENWGSLGKEEIYNTPDRLGGFFDGFCKYARYNKFKVRGILRNGEFNNSANVICSLSFDRDEDYLATGGVSKKIKIFEFQSLFNDSVDIHYPAVEMSNKSKLSCICWNSYIRNYLASTDYDGIVKLWDASTGQENSHFIEHSERAWSVDFSRIDPTKLASGGDDRLVKVWSINEKKSLCTIKNNANVCCVQFSPHSTHLLAFSSADYKTYCYDLRNPSIPWCILAGHEKSVSYAKFLDAGTLVSASTDSTLKIWDLSKTNSNIVSRDACTLTLRGHANEKNFIGLSVNDGYIACGSETNEVFSYHKSLPMPITTHKFGSIDPITGKETEDDNAQFVSSVCWRKKSNMVVAANSSGCIKLLQML